MCVWLREHTSPALWRTEQGDSCASWGLCYGSKSSGCTRCKQPCPRLVVQACTQGYGCVLLPVSRQVVVSPGSCVVGSPLQLQQEVLRPSCSRCFLFLLGCFGDCSTLTKSPLQLTVHVRGSPQTLEACSRWLLPCGLLREGATRCGKPSHPLVRSPVHVCMDFASWVLCCLEPCVRSPTLCDVLYTLCGQSEKGSQLCQISACPASDSKCSEVLVASHLWFVVTVGLSKQVRQPERQP